MTEPTILKTKISMTSSTLVGKIEQSKGLYSASKQEVLTPTLFSSSNRREDEKRLIRQTGRPCLNTVPLVNRVLVYIYHGGGGGGGGGGSFLQELYF